LEKCLGIFNPSAFFPFVRLAPRVLFTGATAARCRFSSPFPRPPVCLVSLIPPPAWLCRCFLVARGQALRWNAILGRASVECRLGPWTGPHRTAGLHRIVDGPGSASTGSEPANGRKQSNRVGRANARRGQPREPFSICLASSNNTPLATACHLAAPGRPPTPGAPTSSNLEDERGAGFPRRPRARVGSSVPSQARVPPRNRLSCEPPQATGGTSHPRSSNVLRCGGCVKSEMPATPQNMVVCPSMHHKLWSFGGLEESNGVPLSETPGRGRGAPASVSAN
jgi:hypothetical protein